MKDQVFKYRLLKTKNIIAIGSATAEMFMDPNQINSEFKMNLTESERDLDSDEGREKIKTFLSDYNNVLRLERFFIEKNRKK
jgi:hypothetical protein